MYFKAAKMVEGRAV